MYQGQWTIGCMVGFSNCNTRRLNVHEMASVARRGDAQQLDDREAGFLCETETRRVTSLIALSILRRLASRTRRVRSVSAELKILICKPTTVGQLFGRNERCDAARFQFANQTTVEPCTVNRDLLDRIFMSHLFLLQ